MSDDWFVGLEKLNKLDLRDTDFVAEPRLWKVRVIEIPMLIKYSIYPHIYMLYMDVVCILQFLLIIGCHIPFIFFIVSPQL